MLLVDVHFNLFFGLQVITPALLAFVYIPALVLAARNRLKSHHSHKHSKRQSIRQYPFHETKVSFCAELTKFTCGLARQKQSVNQYISENLKGGIRLIRFFVCDAYCCVSHPPGW
jgi:hypothetical protein